MIGSSPSSQSRRTLVLPLKTTSGTGRESDDPWQVGGGERGPNETTRINRDFVPNLREMGNSAGHRLPAHYPVTDPTKRSHYSPGGLLAKLWHHLAIKPKPLVDQPRLRYESLAAINMQTSCCGCGCLLIVVALLLLLRGCLIIFSR